MRKKNLNNNLEQDFMLDQALDQNQACAWIRFTWAFTLVG
jgi:hypothetical protein